jgi:hypothetical protein
VRIFYLRRSYMIKFGLQMRSYRAADEDAASEAGGETEESRGTIDAWQQYVADYEADIAGEETSFTQQTIDEEFSTYILSVPKRAVGLNTIKFWEVRQTLFGQLIVLITFIYDRLIRTLSQPSLKLRWTSFLFRPLLSLAKGFFHRVPKLTRKSEIESSLSSWKRCRS